MSTNSNRRRTEYAAGPVESGSVKTPPSARPRRTGGLGSVLRRLFKRKSIKSQISLPSPPRQYGEVSAP